MSPDRWVRRVLDAASCGVVVVTGMASRHCVTPVGDESRRALPGDELLPAANGRWTHAITIRAQAKDIWPWLVHMGCRRAGWYSYDGLDNGGTPSADRIVPAWQHVEIGDLFAWTPTADDGFIVRAFEPDRSLVLGGTAGSLYRTTWAFVLNRIDDRSTRVLARSSGAYTRPVVGLFLWVILRPIHFAMQLMRTVDDAIRVVEARRASRPPRTERKRTTPSLEGGDRSQGSVAEHSSGPGPFFGGPGAQTHIDASGRRTLASCLARPSSMVRDDRSGAFYVTDVLNGRVIVVR